MNQQTLNEKINITSQLIRNICNQAELPIEIISLIIDNIQLEIKYLIKDKETTEQVAQLKNLLESQEQADKEVSV